jgi:hypothetical protein
MGLGIGFRSSCSLTPPNSSLVFPNPNPARFTILKTQQIGKSVVAKVSYPDCTNFEGKKILLYKSTTEDSLRSRKTLDPHFSPNSGGPVARFIPTKKGWKLAVAMAHVIQISK